MTNRSQKSGNELPFFICHLPLVICQILLCDEAFGLRLGCSCSSVVSFVLFLKRSTERGAMYVSNSSSATTHLEEPHGPHLCGNRWRRGLQRGPGRHRDYLS